MPLIVPGVSRARKTTRCSAPSSMVSVPAARSISCTSGVLDPFKKYVGGIIFRLDAHASDKFSL